MFASLVTCTYSVNAESAEPIHFSSGVTLFSPLNRTYNSRYLSLNFSFVVGLGIKYSLNYDIDGKYGGSMPYVIENPEELHVTYFATGLVKLPELSEGSHSLTVNLLASPSSNHIKPSYADTVYFSTDLTPPNILILSPENRTYIATNVTTANIPLNFTLSEKTSKLSYSLNRHNNATIAGNMTLADLSIGSHNITIYARDVAGNTGASETITFTVIEPEIPDELESITTTNEPFPTTLVVASVITVAVVGIGLLVYFRKRKKS